MTAVMTNQKTEGRSLVSAALFAQLVDRIVAETTAERAEVAELASIVTRTLPEAGALDRMTPSRLEEFMTPVALTAHL